MVSLESVILVNQAKNCYNIEVSPGAVHANLGAGNLLPTLIFQLSSAHPYVFCEYLPTSTTNPQVMQTRKNIMSK